MGLLLRHRAGSQEMCFLLIALTQISFDKSFHFPNSLSVKWRPCYTTTLLFQRLESRVWKVLRKLWMESTVE